MLEYIQYLNDEDGTHGGVFIIKLSYACMGHLCYCHHHHQRNAKKMCLLTFSWLLKCTYAQFGWN